MKWMQESAVMKAAWDKLDAEKREGKFPIGVLSEAAGTDYATAYEKVIEIAGGKNK